MAILPKRKVKTIIVNYKKDIRDLKNQVEKLSKQLEEKNISEIPKEKTIDESKEDRITKLEKELESMKEKYVSLLEESIDSIGNRKEEFPLAISNSSATPQREHAVELDKLQVLLLLRESKATSKDFSVSAGQLKEAFAIDRTVRTIKNKLLHLELSGLIAGLGKKPRTYYITPMGLTILNRQQRQIIGTTPFDF